MQLMSWQEEYCSGWTVGTVWSGIKSVKNSQTWAVTQIGVKVSRVRCLKAGPITKSQGYHTMPEITAGLEIKQSMRSQKAPVHICDHCWWSLRDVCWPKWRQEHLWSDSRLTSEEHHGDRWPVERGLRSRLREWRRRSNIRKGCNLASFRHFSYYFSPKIITSTLFSEIITFLNRPIY